MPSATMTPVNHLHAKDWLTADTAWLRDDAAQIDQKAGNGDGKIAWSEIDSYVAQNEAIISAPEAHGAQAVNQARVRISNARGVGEAMQRAENTSAPVRVAKTLVAGALRGALYGLIWTVEHIGAAIGLLKPV